MAPRELRRHERSSARQSQWPWIPSLNWTVMTSRRKLLVWGSSLATVLLSARLSARVAGQGTTRSSTARHRPVELEVDRATLGAMAGSLTSFAVEKIGRNASFVWLRDTQGRTYGIGVASRDLQFKFEVFTLAIETFEAIRRRLDAWRPPSLPADFPPELRRALSTRPSALALPETFERWPLTSWRTDVLCRVEFIIEGVQVGPTFGGNPNAQSAAPPGQVPSGASASCEVAVGLLFTNRNGGRFLIGVDWMPGDMVVTQVAAEIDDYVSSCDRVSLKEYASRPG